MEPITLCVLAVILPEYKKTNLHKTQNSHARTHYKKKSDLLDINRFIKKVLQH